MPVAQWSYKDEGLRRSLSAVIVPETKDLQETIADLEAHAAGRQRPVVVTVQGASGSGGRRTTLKLACPHAEAAATSLKASATNATSDGLVSIRGFLQLISQVISDLSALTVRWRWDDVGLTNQVPAYRMLADLNPARWSQEKDVARVKADLQRSTETGSRPVALELAAKGNDSSRGLTLTVAFDSATSSIAALDPVVEFLGRLKSREGFEPSEEYENYAMEAMRSNGGFEGACVRFTSAQPFVFVTQGAEGMVESFGHVDSVKVDWGMRSASVSLRQCTLVVTADGMHALEGVSREVVSSNMLRQAAATLRSLSEPEAFRQLCMRVMERHKAPNAAAVACQSGICEAAVEAMSTDQSAEAQQLTLQQAGCLLLWWLVSHDPGEDDLAKCKAHVKEAGGLNVVLAAEQAFPEDEELQAVIHKVKTALQ